MSDLRNRLQRLREQTGGRRGTRSDPAAETLASRLARLRVPPPRSSRGDSQSLADSLDCQILAEDVLVRSATIAGGTCHGDTPLDGGWAAVGALLPGFADDEQGGGVAILDCESTGLSGGTGTVAFMVGVARLESSRITITQFLIPNFAAESAMLARLSETLHSVAVLVTYNGKSFDQPLLQSRYRLSGLGDPFAGLQHLDLLAPTRRFFARRWPDCRLATVEGRLLGFERRNDLPGSEAPRAWLEWLRRGRMANLRRVLDHNRWDLLSLVALLPRLADAYAGVAHPDVDPRAMARCLAERQGPEAALQHLCALPGELESVDLREMGQLAKRVGNWDVAIQAWEALAVGDCPRALLELAMHYEHRRRDPSRALEMTERLLQLQGERPELCQRKNRLLAKIAAGPGVAGKCEKLR